MRSIVFLTLVLMTGCTRRPSPPPGRAEHNTDTTESKESDPIRSGDLVQAEVLREGDVSVSDYRVGRGSPPDAVVRRGLLSTTALLSSVVTQVRKERPYVHGSLEGELLIDADGAVANFDEWGYEFYGDADSLVLLRFTKAVAGQSWFKGVGGECSVEATFRIAKPSRPSDGSGRGDAE